MFSISVFWTIKKKDNKIANITVYNILNLAKCFVYITFLNLHNNPVKQILLSFPF